MDMIHTENIAKKIEEKALEIGFEQCGIVPVSYGLEGYTQYLDQRYETFPDDRLYKAASNYKMAHPEEDYPWAKSIIVCTIPLGQYQLPPEYEHRIGRIYAFDYRHEKDAEEYDWQDKLNHFLESLSIRYANAPDRGIVPLRHVAVKAGLGIQRKNNFLYTPKNGSFVSICAWLIDQDISLIHEHNLPPCPPNCHRCMDACPSGSLCAPYTMQRRTCVSPLTSKYPEGADIIRDDLGLHFDGWLYGCDACQEACPHNKKVLKELDQYKVFPRQDEFRQYIDPYKLLELSDEYLEEHFQPRFWYMEPGSAWKWKANAMCDLIHHPTPEAIHLLEKYTLDENEELRRVAIWALEKIK